MAESVRMQRVFDRAPEDVFRALIDPEVYVRWMGPDGSEATVERMDARVGGGFAVRIGFEDGSSVTITGTYEEVDPPTRLSHTWLVEGDPAQTRVIFDLVPEGSGTRLSLRHEGLTDDADRSRNEAGWMHQLDRLEKALVA